MDDAVSGTLGELLELLATALVSVVLAILGAAAELAALGNLSTGQFGIGVWEVALGGLLLYAGCYLLAYRRVLGTLLDRQLARS